MVIILILLFIPVFFVGTITYFASLYEYISNNNMDVVLILIGLFASLISLFIILKEFSLLEIKDYKIIKIQRRVDGIIGLLSFTYLFLFGLSLIINSLTTNIIPSKLLIGISIFIFYLYVIYYYVFKRNICVFKLINITKINDKLFLLQFENKDLGLQDYYFNSKDNYKKNKSYKVSFSKANNNISKVISEVVEV